MRRLLAILLLPMALAAIENPILLYAPGAQIRSVERLEAPDTSAAGDTSQTGHRIISEGDTVDIGDIRSYIMLPNSNLMECSSNATLVIYPDIYLIELIRGSFSLHFPNPPDSAGFNLNPSRSADIRYPGEDSIYITAGDTALWLSTGERFRRDSTEFLEGSWQKRQAKDAEYLFELLTEGIPAPGFAYDFPSTRPDLFHHDARGYGGIAGYEGNEYYYLGAIYEARFWRLEFAYDFLFAFDEKARFYSKNWDGSHTGSHG